MTTSEAPPRAKPAPAAPAGGRGKGLLRAAAAGLVGLLAAIVALAVGQLLAAFIGATSAPLTAVGLLFIDHTPEWLKDFAIQQFGQNDKTVLQLGTAVTVLVLAIVFGVLGMWKRWIGAIGVVLFALVGVFAALTRPTANAAYFLPSLAAGIVGVAAIWFMLQAFQPAGTPLIPGRGRTASSASAVDGHDDVPGPEHGTSDEDATTIERIKPKAATGPFDRRRFLIGVGGSVVLAAVAGGIGQFLLNRKGDIASARAAIRFPKPASPAPALSAGSDFNVNGLTPFVTSNSSFYRVDTALVLPKIDPADWQLRIHGMVDKELNFSFQDLLKRPLIERYITLTCVSNQVGGVLAGDAKWLGVPLAELLKEAGVHSGATQLLSTSDDGYTAGTPVDAVMNTPNAMLALAMNGQPLPVQHGFPVRMIVPGIYGYASATKWLVDLELTTFAKKAYWVPRGYAVKAPIKTFSRIDTPNPLATLPKGKKVAVAGVAWAQTRGIKKVEVQFNDGPWQTAQLADVPTNQTWRQWMLSWTPNQAGLQKITVRATDDTGTAQIEKREPPLPDGATGWHNTMVSVV